MGTLARFCHFRQWSQADRGTAMTLAPMAHIVLATLNTRTRRVSLAFFIGTSFLRLRPDRVEPLSRILPRMRRITKPAIIQRVELWPVSPISLRSMTSYHFLYPTFPFQCDCAHGPYD